MKFKDFEIIWVEICNYPKGTSVPMHSHDFLHFIYVDSGEGSITVENTRYSMVTGRIFPIQPGESHSFCGISDEPLRTFELKFRLNDSNAAAEISKLPVYMDVEGYHVSNSLLSLYREAHTVQPLSDEVISLRFQLLMTYLLRCFETAYRTDEPHSKKKSVSPELERVMAYIRDNLTEELSLDLLAGIAGFEKNYFLRKFKKQTGYSPIDYIRNKRLEKAKELLLYSDMNITQIATASGFKSVHYFSKVFYDTIHIRPSEYRGQ